MSKEFYFKIDNEINQEFRLQWAELEKNNYINLFQSIEWIEYWNKIFIETINTNYKPFYVSVYHNEVLALILPLCIEINKFNIKILKFIGDPYNDICFPVIKKNYKFDFKNFNLSFEGFLKKNNNKFDLIYLKNLLNHNNFCENPLLQNNRIFISDINYYIQLKDWQTYLNEIGFGKNNEVNKKIKILKKKGELKYEFDNNSKKEEILNFIIHHKNKQFNKKKKKNIFYFQKNKKYIENLKEFETAKFSHLSLNNEIISAHVGYLHNRNFYHIMPTHNIDYNKFSPGTILLSSMIKSCCDEKEIKKFDFTIGSEIYKKKWSNNKSILYSYLYYTSFKGFVYNLFLKLKIKFIKKYLIRLK